MTPLEYVRIVIEGGLLMGLVRGLMYAGRVLQKLEDHDRRIEHIENWRDGLAMGAHK